MQNIKFEYLYRDEGNYKTFGEQVFSNPNSLSLEFISQTIESNLIEGSWFDPDKWGIPRFPFHQHNPFGIYDYLWYEFKQVSYSTAPTNSDSITRLLGRFA
ncbi:hypothetical protein J1N10_12055 [Carboxylicivirga sp. A043]|uniref:hypothetical protein n=1 Tax=Carboxylicivirga litoralis TaxID=2816963 RepID=UPI0021CB1DDE|nr:hypothetical protein [Carboxylicivirga sp. A043]MCU4156713.1 hypothetical protein [Carboxylicivirga sp. A043]